MIDFSNLPVRHKAYSGANGSKISVVYNDELYMLKFPSFPNKNIDMGYSNICISEYLGCKIFESIGIPTQEVILGTYTSPKGIKKTVVACKDFTSDGKTLQDFASLKNQIIDSERNGYGTDLNDILSTFEQQHSLNPNDLLHRFWDMFIVDSLIGNWDRHNGNWGFLYDIRNDSTSLAPVFDCGSSLFPQADEPMIQTILSNQNELNNRIFNLPLSAIQLNGKRLNYFTFISSLQYPDCTLALKRILPNININKINKIIDDIPVINTLQKKFYKTIIAERKEHILDYSFMKIRKQEHINDHLL